VTLLKWSEDGGVEGKMGAVSTWLEEIRVRYTEGKILALVNEKPSSRGEYGSAFVRIHGGYCGGREGSMDDRGEDKDKDDMHMMELWKINCE
jgi:hypothetical protein